MARFGTDYGPNGSSHDEFGKLPPKRIESMQGIDGFSSKSAISATALRQAAEEFFKRTGSVPHQYHHIGPYSGCPGKGIMSSDFGCIWIDYVPDAMEECLA